MTTSGRFWPTPVVGMVTGGQNPDTGGQGGLRHAVLTSSPEDSPASPSAPLANDRAHRMTAISGRNLRELWEPCGPVGAFLRMSMESSVWKPALTGYSLTWIRSATPQGRSLYRLRLSAPTTGGIGSGLSASANRLWMTPKAGDADFHTPSTSDRPREMSTHLGTQVMFATPRHEGFDAGAHRGKPDSLHSAVKMLPTPREIYGEHPGMTDPKHLTGAAGASVVTGMKLSAAWVSRLMGYPDFWMEDLPPVAAAVSREPIPTWLYNDRRNLKSGKAPLIERARRRRGARRPSRSAPIGRTA